jgi:hypothetical protein
MGFLVQFPRTTKPQADLNIWRSGCLRSPALSPAAGLTHPQSGQLGPRTTYRELSELVPPPARGCRGRSAAAQGGSSLPKLPPGWRSWPRTGLAGIPTAATSRAKRLATLEARETATGNAMDPGELSFIRQRRHG